MARLPDREPALLARLGAAPGARAAPAGRLGLAAEALRYGIAGGTAVAVLFLVLVALVELMAMPETPASALAFACAVPVNYLLQRRFVFDARSGNRGSFLRHLGVTGLTLSLNTLLFWVLVDALGAPYVPAQILVIAVVVPVSFALSRHYTFGRAADSLGNLAT
jgi:putative flippase GtrA